MAFRKFFVGLGLIFVVNLDCSGSLLAGEATALNRSRHTLCRGSSFGLSHSTPQQYELYRAKYTNCTYVDGNLELVFLDRNYDLSFLNDIREVTGYVLIASVMSDFLSLTNLRIIRGQLLFPYNGGQYSLFVASNYNSAARMGLKELGLKSLHEIMKGDVFFQNNLQLCYEGTIEWNDILPTASSSVIFNDTLPKQRNCVSCDATCAFKGGLHCWGSGPDMCQKMTKLSCSSLCSVRCLEDEPSVCCHAECAGGCTGPTSSMCWACKNFANDGSCISSCPPQFVYSSDLFKRNPNPAFKYSHGSICLDKCPDYLYGYEGACIRECDSHHVAVDGMCVQCAESCPKHCPGTKSPDFVHQGNIASFNGCSIIQGSISVLQSSFTGDPYRNLAGISERDLSVFETVTEIAGYLRIEADAITRLDYFSNLRVIRGVETIPSSVVSLKVFDTRLESLDFQSLKEIRYGDVLIQNNSRLCYAGSISWEKFFSLSEQRSYVSNQEESVCMSDNKTCSVECSSDGCWGPRDDQCLSCAVFSLGRQCLHSCNDTQGLYQLSQMECARCHEQCKGKCTDNSSMTCDECKNVKDGAYCVSVCPARKYTDDQSICQPCHENCEEGCTGSANTVAPGGCTSCALVVLDAEDSVERCLPVDSSCGDGYFKKTLQDHRLKQLSGKQACKRCHPECRICDEYSLSLSSCKSCLYFQQDDRCVRNCSSDYYVKNHTNACERCDSRCLHCTGPTASDCTVCKQYMVYHDMDDRTKGFNCTESCPDHVPHKVIEEIESGEKVTVCVKDDGGGLDAPTIGKIVGSVIGGVIVLSIVIVVVVVMLYKRAQAEANKVRLTAQLYGVTELEPLAPSGISPDLANLRLIKESELRRGAVIGSGAFGTVYKGLWIPENENVKLVVAIKVLAEGKSPSQTQELIDEVRIMASVNDQYCIRILAFCMTAQMMIITQLMPHGCLLDFVRKHKPEIGSKVLLNWCTQIAKGMTYLEERSIVHRDLAARNILVQHPEHLRITDFGLSKLLDYNENVVHALGDKVPVKWMALESILHRMFTHKSDVWSYGVMLWELFTYGKVPYENICTTRIPDVLEKGERLSQPQICTIDVYMLMIKCWVIDAGSRPNFRYLAEEFAKMARDPGRYLVIEGDEFMRIQSPTFGMKELVRYASIDSSGAEAIITADDYLHPRGRIRSSGSQGRNDHLEAVEESVIDEVLGSSLLGPNPNVSSSSGETNQLTTFANRLRRSSQNRDGASGVVRQQSEPNGARLNSRYCSDPCKTALLEQHLQVDNSHHTSLSSPSPAHKSDSSDAVFCSTGAEIGTNPRVRHDAVNTPAEAIKTPVAIKSPGGSLLHNWEPPPPYTKFLEDRRPADEGDYLQPEGEGKPTHYVDLTDCEDRAAESNPMTSFISNPEYFEDASGSGENCLLPKPAHRRSPSQDSVTYYNEFAPNAAILSSSAHNPLVS